MIYSHFQWYSVPESYYDLRLDSRLRLCVYWTEEQFLLGTKRVSAIDLLFLFLSIFLLFQFNYYNPYIIESLIWKYNQSFLVLICVNDLKEKSWRFMWFDMKIKIWSFVFVCFLWIKILCQFDAKSQPSDKAVLWSLMMFLCCCCECTLWFVAVGLMYRSSA